MSQVQCPNCGGYRVIRRTRFNSGCAIPFFLIAGLLMCWGTGDVLLSGDFSQFSLPSICAGFAFVLAALAFYILNWNYSRTHYECLLCGHRWEQRAGQPAPQIHVRSDLIEMGAKRLEEEEARRKERERQEEEDRAWRQRQEEKKCEESDKKAKDFLDKYG